MKLRTRAFAIATIAMATATALALGPNGDHRDAPSAPRQEAQRQEAPRQEAPRQQAPQRRESNRVEQSLPSRTQSEAPRQTYQAPRTIISAPDETRQPDRRPITASRNEPTASQTNRRAEGDRNFQQDSQSHRLMVKGPQAPQNPRWGGHWRDDRRSDFSFDFHFGLYLFSPFLEASFASPWYDYTELPPYIPANAVTVVSGYQCAWNAGDSYSADGFDQGLNQATDSIDQAFLSRDTFAIDSLIPTGNEIAIFNQGQYEYSLSGSDFQQMVADNVAGVDTLSFNVTSIDRYNGGAILHATHVVQSTDGSQETVYQTYRLKLEGGDRYMITDFMTSQSQIGF